jgi:hypothetical protein
MIEKTMKRKDEAFDYGEYDKLWALPKTHKALAAIDRLCKTAGVRYAVVGGLAAYLQAQNPPEDYPDIDVMLYAKPAAAVPVLRALAAAPGFAMRFNDVEEDAVFATYVYGGMVQVDVFTSMDATTPKKTRRIGHVDVEPVEPLIVEKLIRGTPADIRMALDLLAFADYDKALLAQLCREFRVTGAMQTAAYFARRLAVGRMTKDGIDTVVRRLTRG